MWKQWKQCIFLSSKITVDVNCSHKSKRCLLLGRNAMTNPDSILKDRDIILPTKVCIVKTRVFPSSHVWIEGWTIKKSRALENWCFQTVVLEQTLESPMDSKEIQPVNPKGNQPWIFIGRTDAEVELPILWPPDARANSLGKNPDAGVFSSPDEGRRRRGQQRMRWLMASLTQQMWVWANSGR